MTSRGNLAYSDPKLSFSEEVSHEMRFLKDSRSTKARFLDFRKRTGCGAAVSCSDHGQIVSLLEEGIEGLFDQILTMIFGGNVAGLLWRFQVFAFCCLHFFGTGAVFCAHVLWSTLFVAVPL